MKKSSLGRRSSTAQLTRLTSLKSDSFRCSSIPLRVRGTSGDRSTLGAPTPSTKKSSSRNTYIMPMTPSTPQCYNKQLPTGTVRPSRMMTMSTESRVSSFGGTKIIKKDTRPLQDKEWQQTTERKLYEYLISDPDSAPLLQGKNNLKHMSLNLFIDLVNHFLKKFDSSCDINKANYKQELPFLLKKMQYRGKVDKSWLATVNAPHTWGHVLGVLQFLFACVESQCNVDPLEDFMYPASFSEQTDDWDYSKLLPYFIKSFELYNANIPNYEHQQNILDEEVINGRFPEDPKQQIQLEKNKNAELLGEIKFLEDTMAQINLEFFNNTLSQMSDDMKKELDFKIQLEGYIQNLKDKIQGYDIEIENLGSQLLMRQKKKEKLIQKVRAQETSRSDIENLKKQRLSLQRNIESDKKYIEDYSNLVYSEDIKLVGIKKELDKVIREYNMLIANHVGVEPALEEAKIDGNVLQMNSEELNVELTNVIKTLKDKYELLLDSLKAHLRETVSEFNKLKCEVSKERKIVEDKNASLEALLKNKDELIKETESKEANLKQNLVDIMEKRKMLVNVATVDKSCIENKRTESAEVESELKLYINKATQCLNMYAQILDIHDKARKVSILNRNKLM